MNTVRLYNAGNGKTSRVLTQNSPLHHMVSDFSLKNGFIFDKNEGYWAGQRDPSPSPESQRVLERSDFYFGKRNHFCQSYEWYAKLKITYFVQTRCANTRSLRSLAG